MRFLENHDEPRAAATFPPHLHAAAAIVTYLCPGMRFFHQGQFAGRKKRISPHLARAPREPLDADLERFYERLVQLLKDPIFRDGAWRLLDTAPAWEGNWTWDCFIAGLWNDEQGRRRLVAVNYASNHSQCYVRFALPGLGGSSVRFADLLGPTSFVRDGNDVVARGLYLDMPPWGYHVFAMSQ